MERYGPAKEKVAVHNRWRSSNRLPGEPAALKWCLQTCRQSLQLISRSLFFCGNILAQLRKCIGRLLPMTSGIGCDRMILQKTQRPFQIPGNTDRYSFIMKEKFASTIAPATVWTGEYRYSYAAGSEMTCCVFYIQMTGCYDRLLSMEVMIEKENGNRTLGQFLEQSSWNIYRKRK